MSYKVTELTRRNVVEELFQIGNIEGRLNLIDFVEKIWPIYEMPSTDSRVENAAMDIWLHTEQFNDYDNQYLFFEYLDIISCEDEIFIKFLETTVHPEVRLTAEEQNLYLEVISRHLHRDNFEMAVTDEVSGYPIYSLYNKNRGVQGNIKNLIFAANGPKPRIIYQDVLNSESEIVDNQKYCLVYNNPIPSYGLLWTDLVDWWRESQNINGTMAEIEKDLYLRLYSSLDSVIEEEFFKLYFKIMKPLLGAKMPAIIPQVYFHYDPYTVKRLNGRKHLSRERMDFLLLLNNKVRVVIELDGIHHYSDDQKRADVNKYAEMVFEDRKLKLKGYEVYRFGGKEFTPLSRGEGACKDFFYELFKKHHYLL